MDEKEHKSQYCTEHGNEIKEKRARYRALHRKEAAAHSKKYYAKHHKEAAAYGKKYYAKHREEKVAHVKKYRAEHVDEIRVRRKQRNILYRQKCLSAYGRKCACCGESQERFLTIDHVNGDGAAHRKSIGETLYTWLGKHDYPEGFQVLCFNCNCGRQLNGGICPHKETGT